MDKETSAGILFGIGAYGLWGLLPLYFFVLHPAGAVEIVANRVVWSLLFCVLLITITRSWRVLGAAFRNRSVIGPLSIAAGLIAVNWLTYTYGVTTGQAVEASLGYFINPWSPYCWASLSLRKSSGRCSGQPSESASLPWAC